MRIEQQGYTTVQPSYQHVGYVLAAAPSAGFVQESTRPDALGGLGAGLLLLALAVGLLRGRRAARWRWVGASAVLAAVVVAAVGALPTRERWTIGPVAHETLIHIEEASALTDAWIAEKGIPPSPEEWTPLVQRAGCALDGRGRPLEYRVLASSATTDGQPYSVIGLFTPEWPDAEWTPEKGLGYHVMTSNSFGPDGLFATSDDAGAFALWPGDWEIPGRYEHGRAPRTGGGSP